MGDNEYYDQEVDDNADYRSIIVTNLEPGIPELTLHEHFGDPTVGGQIEKIVFSDDYTAAKVTFAEQEVAEQVLQIEAHAIGDTVVYVEPLLPRDQQEDQDVQDQEQDEYPDSSSQVYQDEYPEEAPGEQYPQDEGDPESDSQYGEHIQRPYEEEQPDYGPPESRTSQVNSAESIASGMQTPRSNILTPTSRRTFLPADPSPVRSASRSQRATPDSQQRSLSTPRQTTPAVEEQQKTPTSSLLHPRTPLLQETSPPANIYPDAISTRSQNKSSTSLQKSRASLKSGEASPAKATPPVTPQSKPTPVEQSEQNEKPVSRKASTARLISSRKKSNIDKLETESIKPSNLSSEKEETTSIKKADDQSEHEETRSLKAISEKESTRSVHSDITFDSRPTTRTSQQIFGDVECTLSPRYASDLKDTLGNPEEKLEKHAGIRFRRSIDGEIKISGTMGQLRRAEDYVRMSLARKRPTRDEDSDETGSVLTISSGPTRPPTPPTPPSNNILMQNYALHNVINTQYSHGNTLKMDETVRDYIEHCLKDRLEDIERTHDVQIVYKGSSRVTFLDQKDTWDTQNVLRAISSFKKLYRDTKAKSRVDVMKKPDTMSERAVVFAKQDCERKYPRVMVNKGKPGYISFYGLNEEEVRSAKNYFASKIKTHIEAAGPPSFISPSRPGSENKVEVLEEKERTSINSKPSSKAENKLDDKNDRKSISPKPPSRAEEVVPSDVVMHTGLDHFARSYLLSSKEIKMRIFTGDIVEETVDILINPVNEQLHPSCDIAVTIVKAAGRTVQREANAYIKRYGSLKAGEVAITSAGNLESVTLIIHAVSPRWSEANTEWSANLLSETYRNIFEMTHKYAAVSIAMPPLGTGLLGFPVRLSGNIACAALVSFLKRNPKTSIRDIRIVTEDGKVANRYSNIFDRQFSVGIPSHRGTHPAMRAQLESMASQYRRPYGHEREKPSGKVDKTASPSQESKRQTSSRRSEDSKASTRGSIHEGDVNSSKVNLDSKERKSVAASEKSEGSKPGSKQSKKGEEASKDNIKDEKKNDGSKTSVKDKNGQEKEERPSSQKSKAEDDDKQKVKSWRDESKEENKDAKEEKDTSKDGNKKDEKKEEPEESEEDKKTCRGCSKPQRDPSKLPKCKHKLCAECMEKARGELKCPVCEKTYWPPQGAQPKGTMTFEVDKNMHVAGFEKKPSIILKYDFPEGVQESGHPRPGQKYSAASFKAYLPDNSDGQKLKKLLKTAFDKGLTFGILAAESKDELCTIAWKDIVHKTSITGGPEANGYPDPDYMKRLKEQLKSKGIK
ncbi:uncharacterized protein [Ptychodera flava]|uniref:uncharacterized protein n=1 Tax=Ptychodera flava TaxID=63121 RepID=UPI003969EB21